MGAAVSQSPWCHEMCTDRKQPRVRGNAPPTQETMPLEQEMVDVSATTSKEEEEDDPTVDNLLRVLAVDDLVKRGIITDQDTHHLLSLSPSDFYDYVSVLGKTTSVAQST